jgi:hypothetical protein
VSVRGECAALIAVALAGCGGGSSPAGPPPGGGTTTSTFMGRARTTDANGCIGEAHRITAGAGAVSVTLVQSNPAGPMVVQLCSPTAVNHDTDCTVNRSRIDVGQTLNGTVTGGTQQDLVLNTADCGPARPVTPVEVAYTVSVLFPR